MSRGHCPSESSPSRHSTFSGRALSLGLQELREKQEAALHTFPSILFPELQKPTQALVPFTPATHGLGVGRQPTQTSEQSGPGSLDPLFPFFQGTR